jgi:hypothetical protein
MTKYYVNQQRIPKGRHLEKKLLLSSKVLLFKLSTQPLTTFTTLISYNTFAITDIVPTAKSHPTYLNPRYLSIPTYLYLLIFT